MRLRFCPSCGGKLPPQTEGIRFCPFCGENLLRFAETERENEQDHANGLGEKTEILAEKYYTVVLKSCGNKERLAKRLSEVLRRGLTATRMAVDMVPCVIMYKSKACDIESVVRILEDENLYYTVIRGNFDFSVSIENIIPGFLDLDEQLQLTLRNTPAALWLGEQVRLVVPEVLAEDRLGSLVVTDRSLYVFPDSAGERRTEWFTIPYAHLAEVVNHREQSGELELIYKEYNREEWLRIDNGEQLEKVYEQIRRGLLR
ncbi:MAG: zinc ribbon domain-containing protein [Veillonellales bacterium]